MMIPLINELYLPTHAPETQTFKYTDRINPMLSKYALHIPHNASPNLNLDTGISRGFLYW